MYLNALVPENQKDRKDQKFGLPPISEVLWGFVFCDTLIEKNNYAPINCDLPYLQCTRT